MGNAAFLTCQKCLNSNSPDLTIKTPKNIIVNNIQQKYFEISTSNSQLNHLSTLENSNYNTLQNLSFKKTFHNYFSRNSQPENSIQFTIHSQYPKRHFTFFNKSENDNSQEKTIKLKSNNNNESFFESKNGSFIGSKIKGSSLIDDKLNEGKEIMLKYFIDNKDIKNPDKEFSSFENEENNQSGTLILNKEESSEKINNISKSKTNLLGSPVRKGKKKPLYEDTIIKEKLLNTKISLFNEENNNPNHKNITFNYSNISKNKNLNLNFKKKEKNSLEVSDETPKNILHSYTNLKNMNLKNKRPSISSIFSEIENVIISQHPKGYFLYKSKNYEYYGKKDSNGLKQGFGIVKWTDKSELKSIFENNKINTYAIFTDYQMDFSIFCGKYKDNIPKGYGYYIKDNVRTEGDGWLKNHMNGIGMQIFCSDDHFYQGEFYKSAKSGIGLYRWSDGSVCLGEWNDDKLNGYGIIKYSNDNVYVGQFKENLMDGWGEFLWNDRKYYLGEYKDGLKHGFGIYVNDFKKIDFYAGFWEYGKVNGFGIKVDGENLKIGVWKDGRKVNWIKHWEIKDYVKPSQNKFLKFLKQDYPTLKKFVLKCQKHEIFHEKFLTIIKI